MSTEKEIQRKVWKWIILNYKNYPQLRPMFSTQNGLYSKALTVKLAKLTGFKNGVPDLALPVANKHHHSLWIELKRKGGIVSEEQKKYIELLNFYNNYATVCYGYDEAVETIIKYLKDEI